MLVEPAAPAELADEGRGGADPAQPIEHLPGLIEPPALVGGHDDDGARLREARALVERLSHRRLPIGRESATRGAQHRDDVLGPCLTRSGAGAQIGLDRPAGAARLEHLLRSRDPHTRTDAGKRDRAQQVRGTGKHDDLAPSALREARGDRGGPGRLRLCGRQVQRARYLAAARGRLDDLREALSVVLDELP